MGVGGGDGLADGPPAPPPPPPTEVDPARGGEDGGHVELAGAEGDLLLGVHRAVAVLEVDGLDARAQPAEQLGHVDTADDRPVGVDLQGDGVVEGVGQDLQRGPAADAVLQLELVVVVADGHAGVGGLRGGGVELGGDRRDVLGGGPARGVHVRLDHEGGAGRGGGRQDGVDVAADDLGVRAGGAQPVAGERGREGLGGVGQPEGLDLAEPEARQPRQRAVQVRSQRLADGVQLHGDLVDGQCLIGHGGEFSSSRVHLAGRPSLDALVPARTVPNRFSHGTGRAPSGASACGARLTIGR